MGYRRKRPPVCCTKLFVVQEIEFKIDSKVLIWLSNVQNNITLSPLNFTNYFYCNFKYIRI